MKFIFAVRHFGRADPRTGETYNNLITLFRKVRSYWAEFRHRKKERFDDHQLELNRGCIIGLEDFIKENDFFDVFKWEGQSKISPCELWDLFTNSKSAIIRKEITKVRLLV